MFLNQIVFNVLLLIALLCYQPLYTIIYVLHDFFVCVCFCFLNLIYLSFIMCNLLLFKFYYILLNVIDLLYLYVIDFFDVYSFS